MEIYNFILLNKIYNHLKIQIFFHFVTLFENYSQSSE